MSKKWTKEDGKLILHFEPFYDEQDTVIAEVYQGEDGSWYYDSAILGDQEEWIASDEICQHDLKLEMEETIYNHYEDERNYYQELMEKFSGKD